MEDEEAKRIQEERDKQLTEEYKELQNPKRPDEKQLLGSQLLDNIGGKFTEAGSAVMEAAQEDPDTWTDDAIRIGLGGVKNVGTVLGAPGIKQGLQLLGAPAYYVGRGLGYGLEKAGVDPRYGHIVGEVGEWFIPGYGMYKAAGKIVKGANTLDIARMLEKTAQPAYAKSISPVSEVLNPERLTRIKTLKTDLLQQVRKDLSDTRNPTLRTEPRYNMAQSMLGSGYEPGGIFRYKPFKEASRFATDAGRPFLQIYESPTTIGGASRAVDFDNFRRTNLPALREEFRPAIRALGLTEHTGFNIHHIAALKASMGIWDGLQMDSPLYREVSDTLLRHIPGLGNMAENLRPIIGRAQDIGTPHYLAHRFYADKIGESGELFFTDPVLAQMRVSRKYRIQKANELGSLIAESERIVTQAMQVYTDLYSTRDIPFEEIIERMSQLDEFGYSKLIDPKYQAPNIERLVGEIVNDAELVSRSLQKAVPTSLQNVLDRINAGTNMLRDLIENPNLSVPEAIKRYNIKDPNAQQIVLNLQTQVKQLTPQEVTRIMKAYDKGGKGGTSR